MPGDEDTLELHLIEADASLASTKVWWHRELARRPHLLGNRPRRWPCLPPTHPQDSPARSPLT